MSEFNTSLRSPVETLLNEFEDLQIRINAAFMYADLADTRAALEEIQKDDAHGLHLKLSNALRRLDGNRLVSGERWGATFDEAWDRILSDLSLAHNPAIDAEKVREARQKLTETISSVCTATRDHLHEAAERIAHGK